MIRARSNLRRHGFTILEAALATVIVGVGLVATMQLFASCTIENQQSGQMSVAMLLSNNVQELMGGLTFADPGVGHTHFGPEAGETLQTYNDIDDFDGSTFSPPINSQRQQIANLSQFSQVVSVWPVDPNKLSTNSNTSSPDIPKGTYTGAVRVTVRILFARSSNEVPAEVYRASWIRLDD